MATFPLKQRPAASYHERPRAYGSPRDNGKRQHAGCDLYAPVGSPVVAVADGTVVRGPYPFYDVVYALEVEHPGIGIVRYGEVTKTSPIHQGDQVTAGQVIAYVGHMQTVNQSMLHFELFSGCEDGPLTDRAHAPFMRRADLIDPTAFLDSCTLAQ
jgi:murein DD-endopeptidase MepM/ murein hydrolase activator NlpD